MTMKIEYVNAKTNDILTSLEIQHNISEEQIKIVEGFNKSEIHSFNIEFNPGLLCEQTHNLSNVKPDMISKMTIYITPTAG